MVHRAALMNLSWRHVMGAFFYFLFYFKLDGTLLVRNYAIQYIVLV